VRAEPQTRAKAPAPSVTTAASGLLQRKCACGGTLGLASECSDCREKQLSLQRGEGGGSPGPAIVPPIVHEVLRSHGQPLEAGTRSFMESRLGHDFSQVRVHIGSQANESAKKIGALAYTMGQNIVFATGNPRLETPEGVSLLAHELAHVVQQGGAVRNESPVIIDEGRNHREAEADEVARSVASDWNGARSSKNSRYIPIGLKSESALQRKPAGEVLETQPTSQRDSSEIKPVKIWLNAFIPGEISGLTREVTNGPYKGKSVIPGPIPGSSDCFLTDNRSFSNDIAASARMHSEVRIDFAREFPSSVKEFHDTGRTHELDCEDGSVECNSQASKAGMKITRKEKLGPLAIDLYITGAAHNPCFTGSPDIDYDGLIRVDAGLKYVSFVGRIDDFPAFEMYATIEGGESKALFQLAPKEGKGPIDLFGEATREAVGVANFDGKSPEPQKSKHGEKSPKSGGDGTSPWELGVEWLLGVGRKHHKFGPGDYFTTLLQKHEHVILTKDSIKAELEKRCKTCDDTSFSGDSDYKLGGVQGVPKYFRDYSTLLTGGATGNLAATFLGSYSLKYSVSAVSCHSGKASIDFHVSNSSTMSSATHPPVIGYTDWWSSYVGEPLDTLFSSGPMSATTQEVDWSETLNFTQQKEC
jgi:Domain of unknown function (DUF4157)